MFYTENSGLYFQNPYSTSPLRSRELKLVLATEKILSMGVKAGCKRRSQLATILIVGNSPGCQICHVKRLLEVKHQTASLRLAKLIAGGFVRRDGRKFYLTESGQKAFDLVIYNVVEPLDTYRRALIWAVIK